MKKTAVALVLALLMTVLAPCALADGGEFAGVTLTVFNCYDYIDPEVLTIFEQETGAHVEYVNYTTNEEMYTKLEAGAANYDIIFPSDYMIERLIREDRLETIDRANIPNADGVIETLRNPDYDPEEQYSVPYMWGTFGILYNTEMVDAPIDSWTALFDEKYAGKVFMMNSQRDTIGLALKMLGYSMNSRDEGELEEAKNVLIAQKQAGIPAGYMLDEIKDKMVGNEAAMGIVYTGDAIYAMEKNDKLDYVSPEGRLQHLGRRHVYTQGQPEQGLRRSLHQLHVPRRHSQNERRLHLLLHPHPGGSRQPRHRRRAHTRRNQPLQGSNRPLRILPRHHRRYGSVRAGLDGSSSGTVTCPCFRRCFHLPSPLTYSKKSAALFIACAGSICRELKCLRILQILTSHLEKC